MRLAEVLLLVAVALLVFNSVLLLRLWWQDRFPPLTPEQRRAKGWSA